MTLVIAHRGASAQVQENTIGAFERALELGADWVELDVRRAACGTPVVHHDAVLSDGQAICTLAADALPSHVATLHDVLVACGSMGVDIEIKSDQADPDYDDGHLVVEAVVDVAGAVLPRERTLISSFDMSAINRVHDLAAHVPTGFITADSVGVEVLVGRAVAHGHSVIKPHDSLVTRRFVDAAHEAGLLVYMWTVDDPGRMAELVALGVDGITTNKPDVAREVLG